MLAEGCEGTNDRGRQVVGDRDPFERVANLGAKGVDRRSVVRLHTRQPIEQIIERPRFHEDPAVGVGRHAIANRHLDAHNSRELAESCSLSADELDLRPVDLTKVSHIAIARDRVCCCCRHGRVMVSTPKPLAASPLSRGTLLLAPAIWVCRAHRRRRGPPIRALFLSPMSCSKASRSWKSSSLIHSRSRRRPTLSWRRCSCRPSTERCPWPRWR